MKHKNELPDYLLELFADDGQMPLETPKVPAELYWPDPDYPEIIRDLVSARSSIAHIRDPIEAWSPLDVLRRCFLESAKALAPDLLPELVAAKGNNVRLKKWRTAWCLTEPWCSRLLLSPLPRSSSLGRDRQLQFFLRCDRLRREYGKSWVAELNKPHETPVPGFAVRLSLPFVVFYNPEQERREDFRKRVIHEVDAAIKETCDEAIARGREMGMEIVPKKRTRKKGIDDPKPNQHFEWLAQYQVLRKLPSEIAKQWDGDWRTIKKAIKETADQIGLNLR